MDAPRCFVRRPLLIVCLALVLPILPAGAASAAWISLGGNEGSPVDVRVLESSPDRIVLDYTIPGFYADPIQIEGKTYYSITLPGEGRLLEKGLPELPRVSRSVIIPDQSRMEVRLVESQVTEFDGYPIAPSKGNLLRTVDPSTIPYPFDPAYQQAQWWPAETVRGGEPYVLRDYRGVAVEVTPFQAQGPTRGLRAASHIQVEITSSGIDTRNTIERTSAPDHFVAEFADIYQTHFLNWNLERYTPILDRGKMLVITYDAFHDSMVPFVEWKNQMGMPTRMVDISTIGNTSTQIDAYIDNVYNTEGIAFVLLVGDGTQIATPHAAGGASDPTYAKIVGTDNYPEIFVGRFSAETAAQVQTQVARSIAYEKTPMAGASWYQVGTGIGSDQGPGDDGEYDYQHQNVIRNKLLGFTYASVDQIYDPGATAAMVTSALNAGRSIVNYTGHGSQTSWGTTGFSNTNVTALTNDWMLPFIFSVACVNGQFEGATCFAEAWLRATHNGNPTGAVATYMSSINQSWNPPMCAQDAAIDLLVQNQKRTFGGLCYNGSCQMMDEYGSDGQNMFLTWHIFGDPSLVVRTARPGPMTANHAGSFLVGAADYPVTIPGLQGALCALYGDGILYGSAYTDASGLATIHMAAPPAAPMTLTLTVTAFNKIPIMTPVEVLPLAGPFIVYSGVTVLDCARGDGNGACDAGEEVGLSLALKNTGIESADDVTAVISSSDPYAQITVSEQGFGEILPDSVVACLIPYGLHAGVAPDQHVIPFDVAVHSPQGDWNLNFGLTVVAPVLNAGSVLIDDSLPWGNANGSVDPGDSCFVQLRIGNTGHGAARGLTGTLTCADPDVEILDGTGECLIAPALGQGLLSSFLIHVLPSCPTPVTLTLHVSLTGPEGPAGELDYPILVGSWADDVEIDRGWTLGLPTDTATTGQWVRVDPVGALSTGGQQAQTEDDHTPAPGVMCFVTGNGAVGAPAGDSDVDGGKTTLVSPVFHLGGAVSATIQYWRWYTNNLGNSPGLDYWDVEVTSDGTNWVQLEHTTASAATWTMFSFDLESFIPLTDQVRIRFVADDTAPGSLVKAAVDDIVLSVVRAPVTDAPTISGPARIGLVSFSPNPVRSNTMISYRLDRSTHVRLELFDVSGRLVRLLADGPVGVGEHSVRVDASAIPAGVYFVRLDTPEITQVRQVAVVR
jgi:hypothetical protein